MLTAHDLFNAAQIAVFAVVFSTVLIQPGNIFARLGDWLETLPEPIGKPLGLCAKCFAGQSGLWYALFNLPFEKTLIFTTATILSSIFLTKWASS
jgi:hypothetical protein